jgi:hypothetical protein
MMRRRITILCALALTPMLQGCIAAVAAIPLMAMGTMATKGREEIREERERRFAARLSANLTTEADSIASEGDNAITARGSSVGGDTASPGLAAITAMAGPSSYAPMTAFALSQLERRAAGQALTSAVLAGNADIRTPRFTPCNNLPPAVLIDLDDKTLGPNPALADPGALVPLTAEPGLAGELARLRTAGVAVLWMSDHPFDVDQAIYARLQAAGLDPAGRDPVYARMVQADRKHDRRQEVASRYCVLAVVGDTRTDAEESYDYLLRPELAAPLEPMWGAGWFILPLPLHGGATPTP